MSGSGTHRRQSHLRSPAPQSGEPGRWRKHALAAGFLAPAVFFLVIWVVYPTVRTIFRSFFDTSGDSFVWFDNYEQIFTSDMLLTAVKNNFIWIAVVPALVTIFGLDLRRLDGAGQLVGRLQDRGLHADGHLGLRSGHHVAHHLHPGSGAGCLERGDRGRPGHLQPARASSRRRSPRPRSSPGRLRAA